MGYIGIIFVVLKHLCLYKLCRCRRIYDSEYNEDETPIFIEQYIIKDITEDKDLAYEEIRKLRYKRINNSIICLDTIRENKVLNRLFTKSIKIYNMSFPDETIDINLQ